ncbi:UNVERIFIED_CONTAM: GDT1-like protein 5 [Sesamum latifolium]|uniref:GDT1 family protein n=1 Tax=Sesamum latifolium TaxID=2727402 RepID=A0AAW2X499_9LAMI
MTVLSEIGDKTFFAAAILAMRHPRRLVLSGCLGALIVMTILSAVVGWAAPNLIPRKWTHHITTLLFLGFGLWSLWDAFNDDGEAEELAEVEKELDAAIKSNGGETKENNKAFSITFFGEWGDKSQLATIGLAADENPLGVVLGGILRFMSMSIEFVARFTFALWLHSLEEFFSLFLESNPFFQLLSEDASKLLR